MLELLSSYQRSYDCGNADSSVNNFQLRYSNTPIAKANSDSKGYICVRAFFIRFSYEFLMRSHTRASRSVPDLLTNLRSATVVGRQRGNMSHNRRRLDGFHDRTRRIYARHSRPCYYHPVEYSPPHLAGYFHSNCHGRIVRGRSHKISISRPRRRGGERENSPLIARDPTNRNMISV